MAVVINVFEVVDTAPPAARSHEDGASTAPAPPLPEPEDLRRLLAQGAERELRRSTN